MGINKSTFYYDLPGHLIAQEPLGSRSASRLLVLDRKSGEMRHRKFDDISDYLKSGDCLVINDTKVMPARLMGVKKTGAVIEVLLLKRLGDNRWEALVKPGRRVRNGDIISFGDGLLTAEAEEVLYDGVRVLKLDFKGVFEEILDTLGEMPLPPYITKKLADKSRYQTVYAEKTGSAAAPTAGLHFTEKLIGELKEKGVIIAKVTLHVGLGTFRPIKSENILDHEMHSEYYKLDKQNADIINKARVGGGRIICVGTTSVRTLETIADENGNVSPQEGFTDIFIYPANAENPDSIGYKFKITDALITNFHLPESTLMALVSAFAGTESIIGAYKTAVRMEYRFFSFGDAMIIV